MYDDRNNHIKRENGMADGGIPKATPLNRQEVMGFDSSRSRKPLPLPPFHKSIHIQLQFEKF